MDLPKEKIRRVLIVDDEYMIIEGLKKMIDWQGLSLELAGTAQHGAEALTIVESEPLDIILTDINMPRMNGLDFIAQVKTINPEIGFIFISGYEKFDYVKQGLSLGASEYLLKPINKVELHQSLLKLKAQLDKSSNQVSEAYLKKQKIADWLQDVDASYQAPPIQGPSFDFYFLSMEASWDKDQLLDYYHLSPDWLLVGRVDGLFVVLSLGGQGQIRGNLEYKLTGLSAWQVHQTYLQVRKKMRNLSFYIYEDNKSDRLAYLTDLKGLNDLDLDLGKLMTQILQAIEASQFSKVPNMLDQLKTQFIKQAVNRDEAIQMVQVFTKTYDGVQEATDFQNVDQLFDHVLSHIQHYQHQLSFDRLHPTLQAVLQYVEDHYHEDISLSSLADQLHMNVMYLGQIFKREMGTSFSKYINKFRIDKAKDLLVKSHLSIAEISLAVGYQNQAYFYRIFKDIEGLSPKEYRHNHIEKLSET